MCAAETSCSSPIWSSPSRKAASIRIPCWFMPPAKPSVPWRRPVCASPRGRGTAATRWTWRRRPDTSNRARFEDTFVDLNLDASRASTPARQFSRFGALYLPNTALGAEPSSLDAKDENHHWAGATLAMKNLFGVVAGRHLWMAQETHSTGPASTNSIADLHAALSPRTVRHRRPSWHGRQRSHSGPRRSPWEVLVAGRDPAAVDATCSRIMRIEPSQYRVTCGVASAGDRTSPSGHIRTVETSL